MVVVEGEVVTRKEGMYIGVHIVCAGSEAS